MPEKNLKKRRINLLTQEFRTTNNFRFLNRASYILLGIYIFVLVLVFGVYIFTIQNKNSLSQKSTGLINGLREQKETEELLATVKNRTNLAQTLFAKSAPAPTDTVNQITGFLPEGVELSNVKVDREGNIIVVAHAPISTSLSLFLQNLKQNNYSSVYLNTLSLNNDGDYIVSLDIKQ